MATTLKKRGLPYKVTFLLFLWMAVMLMYVCLIMEPSNIANDGEGKLKYLPRRLSGPPQKETSTSSLPLHFELKPINGTNVTILHNAVPKTGSRTLELFLRLLGTRRMSLLHCYTFPPNISKNADQIRDFVGSMKQGSYTRGHFPFTNVSRWYSNTRYINIVRPPIQRLLSNYYYDLYGDKQQNQSPSFHEPTLDECLEKEVCFIKVYSYYKQTTLRTFCGQDPRCNQYTRWTLEKAIENARKYLFIGVTNQLNESISILETLLPDLFNGLTKLFLAGSGQVTSDFKTVKKMQLQNKSLEFLQRDMDLEFEFYQFVLNGFNRALTELMLKRK
ncbi:Heparan sulfate 2-O-sulfotransferase 1 [Holothuria leucospilota]|uniref:Heparan sulfate 2-O-sulfotransferase 1 n=1 Tax=Holothuria leucospilota TaxID=206669 RepID=A0A9Q1BEX7_HOLLE|nr:Heparan sulfate 2-O-sulfotransferase 1 [Holothuria leucospilota]